MGDPGPPRSALQERIGQAALWRRSGDYRRSGLLLALTLRAAEAEFGVTSEQVAVVCNEIGVLGKYTGDFERAERHYRRALDICVALHGDVHDSVATLYHNIGGLAHARGEHRAGEPFGRRAVDIRTRLYGPDDPAVAADIVAWAALVDGCGGDAEPLLRRALRIIATVHGGGDHTDVAAAMHNLAALWHRRGDRTAAVVGYSYALVMRERVHGPDHPELATTLVGLAGALRLRPVQDHVGAAKHYARAIRILTPVVSAAHPVLTVARAGLAACERATATPNPPSRWPTRSATG